MIAKVVFPVGAPWAVLRLRGGGRRNDDTLEVRGERNFHKILFKTGMWKSCTPIS